MRWIPGMAACVLAVAAATVAGGAERATPPNDALAQVVATPRYYAVAVSGALAAQDGAKMCIGGKPLQAMIDNFQQIAKDPAATAALSKGCTRKVERPGPGTVRLELDCDEAASAAFTSRMTLSGSIDDWRQHSEVTLKGLGPEGTDRVAASDTRMTYLGDCPANVKPGQVLAKDGALSDPFADLTGTAKAPTTHGGHGQDEP